MIFNIPAPDLQVTFGRSLGGIRKAMLQEALMETVGQIDLPTVDRELAALVPGKSLSNLAAYGLRGELMFPVPAVLKANPRLVGYYRLLYGFSQKEFHKPSIGSIFKIAEEKGVLSPKARSAVEDFCRAMAGAGSLLLSGISTEPLNAAFLDHLTLLTLGPQRRGGANVERGRAAIAAVFGIIKNIVVGPAATTEQNRINFQNAAGRMVSIEFAPDPDIIIREELPSRSHRHIVAIEVKGGTDFANINNRIGEAEKSHQKARAEKYTECWTVVNVDRLDVETAKKESPSTDRFYRLSELLAGTGAEYHDFHDRLASLAGIRTSRRRRVPT